MEVASLQSRIIDANRNRNVASNQKKSLSGINEEVSEWRNVGVAAVVCVRTNDMDLSK